MKGHIKQSREEMFTGVCQTIDLSVLHVHFLKLAEKNESKHESVNKINSRINQHIGGHYSKLIQKFTPVSQKAINVHFSYTRILTKIS